MEPIIQMWLPILLSAVAVFILSSIIHMVLKYHNNDFVGLDKEEQVMDDLRKYNIPPGEYFFPRAKDMKEMSSPEYIEKMKRGPVGFMTVMENAPPNLNKQLIQWFLFSIVVGIFAAYIAGHGLGPGARYLAAFRLVGSTAFVCYGLALIQNSIWYKRNWGATIKSMFDGLIYALFTGGIFGWLWPM